jgi:hypothetical protein
MFRGYRGVFLAAVGLTLIGAAPNKDGINQTNQPPSQNPVADQLKEVAAAIKESNKSPQPDNGCKAGQDNRSSDLCAQWKAADAASNAAWWTFFAAITTVVGVIIGGFTLIAASFAAWYAKKAAIETEKGAIAALEAVSATNLANKISQSSVQAWICPCPIDVGPIRNTYFDEIYINDGIGFVVSWKNFGQTPALAVGTSVSAEILYPDGATEILAQFHPIAESDRSCLLGPGGIIRATQPIPLNDAQTTSFRAQKFRVRISTQVIYNEIGTTEDHESICAFDAVHHGGKISETGRVGDFREAIDFIPVGRPKLK